MYSSAACPCNGVIPLAPCPVLERGGTPLIIPGFHSTVCFREVGFKVVSFNSGFCSTIPFFRGWGEDVIVICQGGGEALVWRIG